MYISHYIFGTAMAVASLSSIFTTVGGVAVGNGLLTGMYTRCITTLVAPIIIGVYTL